MERPIKYKLLRDLPWINAGAIFAGSTLGEFYYPEGYELNPDYGMRPETMENKRWFQPINQFNPDLGQWVFNEKTKSACKIVSMQDMENRHANALKNIYFARIEYECSPEAVRDYPEVYKRFAEPREINLAIMQSYIVKDIYNTVRVVRIMPNGDVYLKESTQFHSSDPFICNLIDVWNYLFTPVNNMNGSGTPIYSMHASVFKIGCCEIKRETIDSMQATFRSFHEASGDWDNLKRKFIK